MTHDFIYHNPTKVYFGNGMLAHLPEEISRLGSRVLLITGGSSAKKSGLFDKVLAEISKANVDCYGLSDIKPNPEIGLVREGIRLVREKRLDLILALGGGSVLDTAKVIAGSAPYDADPWDLIRNRAAIDTALPLITIPTIAATGSEMNASAVITNPETEEKYGWTAQAFRPSVSFLCPENTYTVPAYQTACGSADILSHIMEVYFQKEETFPATEAYMEAMMRSVMKDAPIAMAAPANEDARANLLWTASWAINDFIDSGHAVSWTCHGIEHELSAHYDITHGLGLAILTPAFLTYVLDETTAPRIARFAVGVMGVSPKGKDTIKIAQKGIKRLRKYFKKQLRLPTTLTEIGIDDTRFAEMAEKTIAWKGAKDGLLHGFTSLSAKDLEEIYRLAL